MTHAQTPAAIRHDVRALAKDARALLDATAELTDQKITQARERLNDALEAGKRAYGQFQDGARERVTAADETIRSHPYESIAIAFGLGALVALVLSRRRD
jgi:ElaB/YqjD/DUF883 family membrane-anchored ribosome-binding protein